MFDTVIAALNARGFHCTFVENAAEAQALALQKIGSRSVGFGGSKTVNDLGIYELLQAQGNPVYWHWKVEASRKREMLELAEKTEVYLCSTNAITEDGRLINIDGTGNRAAAMFFGPPTVLVIAGINKLVKDYDEAIARIKRDACPANARRLGLSTPCAITGHCTDCKGKARMCNVTTIMEYPTRYVEDFEIILVNEKLGL